MYKINTTYFKFRYLVFFFALIAGWPCVFYLMGWLPHYTINYIVLFALVGVTALLKNSFRHVPKPIFIILVLQILVWLFYALIWLDTSYLTRVGLLITTLGLVSIQLSDNNTYGFVKVYNFWLVLQVLLGSIGFILVLFGLLEPVFQFIEMDGRPGYFYGFFTTNAVFSGMARNAGFFDEPGALANWGLYSLVINKLFLKNRRIEILLILGLISTLSMAYFILIALYALLFYRKQRKKLFLTVIVLLITVTVISSISDVLYQSVFGRFEINQETGLLKGDNRTVLFLRTWSVFSSSPWVGVGATNLATVNADELGFVGANFFVNWASDGLLGVFVSYLPLFFLFVLGRKNRFYKYAAIIIFMGYVQRPYTETQLLYPLLLYTILTLSYFDVYRGKPYKR